MAAKVTIEAIAKQANTSPSTVSLVLRNRPGIGSETRQRVLSVAQALGYRRRASAPVTLGPSILNAALILRFGHPAPSMAGARPPMGPFYSWIVMGIEAAARAHRVNLLFATLPVDDHNWHVDLPTQLLDQPLDGVLLVGSFREETIAAVAGVYPRPLVVVDGEVGPHRHDSIVSDHETGAHRAVCHLIRAGHRRIGLVGPRLDLSRNFRQRHAGYLRALGEHGIEETFVEESQVAAEDGVAAARSLLERHRGITAVFGTNDEFAIATMRAAHSLHRRIPGDLSIIGFDDITHARETIPPLTTMAIDKVGMGRLAVQALTYRLTWPDSAPAQVVLQPRLVERGSVAPRVDAATGDAPAGD